VHGSGPDLEEILPQQGDRVGAGEAGGGIGERPLEERGAEGHGEGIEVELGTEPTALRGGVEPDLEHRARYLGRLEIGLMSDADGRQLVPDVVAEALGRILVEPFGGEIVPGVAAHASSVGRFHVHHHVEEGKARERDDAVPEGQPRLEVPDVKRSGLEREPYWNAGMTSLAISSSSRMMWRCGMPGKKSRQMRWLRP
jgi:hypothetical protein